MLLKFKYSLDNGKTFNYNVVVEETDINKYETENEKDALLMISSDSKQVFKHLNQTDVEIQIC